MLACHLINLRTGQQIKARSVADFCRKTGMNRQQDKIHMYPVIREERLHHKDWCLPKFYNLKIELADCYGNSYNGYVRDLLYTYNIKPSSLWNLIVGRKKIVKGLFLKSSEIVYVPPKPYKVISYELETPNQKVVNGKSVMALQRQIQKSLTYKRTLNLIHGKTSTANGYKVKKIVIEKRKVLTLK